MQHMLKMKRGLYTGGNLSKYFRKIRWKIGELIFDHDLTNLGFGANFIFSIVQTVHVFTIIFFVFVLYLEHQFSIFFRVAVYTGFTI